MPAAIAGLLGYLGDREAFGTRRRAAATVAILVAWFALVLFAGSRHEVTRDEARALAIAIQPESILGLPAALQNEGHPVLWYAALRVAHGIVPATAVLKGVSLVLALAGVAVLFRWGPFPNWQKLLFLFGSLPSYEYSVVSRNYGISLVFFFGFAALYPHRRRRPLLLGLCLAALANTNVHSCILSGLLAAYWLVDETFGAGEPLARRDLLLLGCALAVAAAGMAGCLATTLPTKESIVTNAPNVEAAELLRSFGANLAVPARHLAHIFPPRYLGEVVGDLVLWILIAGLLVRPPAAAALLLGSASLGTLFEVGYAGEMRHEGLLVVFAMTLYWIVGEPAGQEAKTNRSPWRAMLNRAASAGALTVTFVILFGACLLWKRSMVADLLNEQSSSRAFGEFLDGHPEYRKAVLLGEPDYLLEPMPYYVRNRIYVPREGRYAPFVRFTKANRETISLGELLDEARRIRETEGVPVLLELGLGDLAARTSREMTHGYGRVFTWTALDLARLSSEATKVAEFSHAVSDENFEIYEVR